MASVGDEHSRPPRLSDFGLTTADEEAIRRWYRFRLGSLAPLVVLIGIGGLIGIIVDTRIKAAGVGGLIGAMLWPWADEWIFPLFERLDPRFKRYKTYRTAVNTAETARLEQEKLDLWRRQTFWRSLNGHQFERELTALLRRCGYDARCTLGSGDQGIDIVIFGDDKKTTIVQCKQTSHPVGPSVVRDLYGTMIHASAP